MTSDRLLRIVVLLLVAALCLGGYAWWRTMAATRADNAAAQKSLEQARPLNEPLVVTMYCPEEGLLAPVQASVSRQPDTQSQAREAVAALFIDPRSNQAAALRDLRLQGFYLDAAGTAYVDLAPVGQLEVRASAWEELIALHAIVNTLTQNFEEIKQVRFLVESKEAQTLAGHIELSRVFTKRMDLVRQ